MVQTEIVQGQTECLPYGFEAALHVFHHDVDLDDLCVIVQLQGHEVGFDEATLFGLKADGHGRAENRQAFIEPNDLHFM